MFGMTEAVIRVHLRYLRSDTVYPVRLPARGTRAASPIYFSPIPQGWGIHVRTLFRGLKA